jgi:tetratricopeptide (TPR) repeat protein
MSKLPILLPLFFLLSFIFFGICQADDEFFQKGLTYYQNREFQLAAATLEQSKKIAPREPLVYFYLGNCYYQLGDLDAAIMNFTAGLNFADNKGVFFYNLGNCYFLKENYEFAVEMYTKAIQYDPALFDSYLNAGNAAYKEGDIPQTIIQWETYLRVYPQTPQYEKIQKALAYLRGELSGSAAAQAGKEEMEQALLEDVLSDLEELINRTENVMETSEKPIDDLTKEEIER